MALPETVAARLLPEPAIGRGTLLRLTFMGEAAEQPAISRLGRDLAADVNLLAGQIHRIAGRPFSVFIVEIPAALEARALQLLAGFGVSAEVLGHVA